MSNDNNPPTNLLFSPSNNFNFTSNTMFMPVTEQNSTLLCPIEPGEEEQFLGVSSSTNTAPSKKDDTPAFSVFSNNQPSSADPFSSIGSNSATVTSNTSISAHEEPKLFVPSSSPSPTSTSNNSLPFSSTTQPNLTGPPIAFGAPPTTGLSQPNQYNRAPGVQRHRPMFVPNSYIPTNSAPASSIQPNFPPQNPDGLSSSSVDVSCPPAQLTGPSVPTIQSSDNLAPVSTFPPVNGTLQPVTPHWFFCKVYSDNNQIWCPFSYSDSNTLENFFQSGVEVGAISTDGGRYDVDIINKERVSVYWDEAPSKIKRCTWFWKADTDAQFHPCDEDLCGILEEQYVKATMENTWHKKVNLPNNEVLALHGPQLVVHFTPAAVKDEFGSFTETNMRSRVVKRGISSTDLTKDVPQDEVGIPDHVVFVCHGVGPVCDLRKRSIVECVDDFRSIHQSLLRSHFKSSFEFGKAKRIEFLPIHWHRALHGDATGVDSNIRRLTLPSISRLRQFTNETLLDILFYSSPVYCQTIAETVGSEINSLYQLFMTRNPSFQGRISLAGHSLGSLILFDLLCHQKDGISAPKPIEQNEPLNKESQLVKGFHSTNSLTSSKSDYNGDIPTNLTEVLQKLSLEKFMETFESEQVDLDSLLMCSESDLKDLGVPMGPRKKLAAFVKDFKIKEEIRKEQAELASNLPTGDASANQQAAPDNLEIQENLTAFNPLLASATNVNVHFQQFDTGTGQPAVQYPQLDFKPHTLFAFGSPIGMFLSVRGIEELGEDFKLPTCDSFINVFHPFDPVAYRVEPLINPEFNCKPILVPHHMGRKRLHLELRDSLGRMGQELKQGIMRSVRLAIGSVQRFAQQHWHQEQENASQVEEDVKNMTEQILNQNGASTDHDDTASVASEDPFIGIGRLNGGKRIDHVLQERPLESFNDYLFAFQSHLCYWNNEDTVLLLMKSLYENEDILSDRQLAKKQGQPKLAAGDSNVSSGPPLQPINNFVNHSSANNSIG